MSQDEKAPEPTLRNLRDVLARDLPQGERPLTYSTQRLQPTVVPPPPSDGYVSELPQFDIVSPDDDIEPDHAEELASKRKRMMAAVACIALFGLVGLGYFALNRSTQPASSVVIPEIKADLPAQAKVLPPSTEPTEQAASSPNDSSMGQVSTELVPPTTDGLSPARKISTTRIVVENDLEVQTLK
jgi:hypothetical protein